MLKIMFEDCICPNCGEEESLVKWGKTINNLQRVKCKACSVTYTLNDAFEKQKVSIDTAQFIIAARVLTYKYRDIKFMLEKENVFLSLSTIWHVLNSSNYCDLREDLKKYSNVDLLDIVIKY